MKTVHRAVFAGVILLLAASACRENEFSQTDQTDGHRAMLNLLTEVSSRADEDNVFTGTKRLRQSEHALGNISSSAPPAKRWSIFLALGKAQLADGRETEAIQTLEEALRICEAIPGDPGRKALEKSWFELGVAYLRMAETVNCCAQHSAESCILPIRGEGFHPDRKPSAQAIECFTEVLRLTASPKKAAMNLEARWLLNIAAMTIGDYPEKVPVAHRIPPETFRTPAPFPRFVNRAIDLGVDCFGLAGGTIADDFDNDSDIDLFVSNWDPDGQLRYFENRGSEGFAERTKDAGLTGLFGGLNLVQADYNNDGWIDVLVLRGAWQFENGKIPNSLLRNNGNGTFTDVTLECGMGENHYPAQSAAWSDFDRDGDLDLFVGNESLPSGSFTTYGPEQEIREGEVPSQLFRNNGDGTFTDIAREAGVENFRLSKGVSWGDINGDGLEDLYVSNLAGANRLYQNNGDNTFTDVAIETGTADPLQSFATWFWDVNNDGNDDLFVASYGGDLSDITAVSLQHPNRHEKCRLYLGNGQGKFEESASGYGLNGLYKPMAANFGDLDNDGFVDFYLGTGFPDLKMVIPNRLFKNNSGQKFEDITYNSGLAHLQKGHGIAFADFDDDGDLDLYEQMGGAYPGDAYRNVLYENPGFQNHWVKIRLKGKRSNRSGLGALLELQISDGGSLRKIFRRVNSGGSFGANPLMQSIGLGKADRILQLKITWPFADSTDVLENLPVDCLIEIAEGEEKPFLIDTP